LPIDVSGVEKRFSLSNNLILVELLCYLISVESVVAFNLAWCSVLVFVPIALGKRWLAKVLVLARLRSGCYAFFRYWVFSLSCVFSGDAASGFRVEWVSSTLFLRWKSIFSTPLSV